MTSQLANIAKGGAKPVFQICRRQGVQGGESSGGLEEENPQRTPFGTQKGIEAATRDRSMKLGTFRRHKSTERKAQIPKKRSGGGGSGA